MHSLFVLFAVFIHTLNAETIPPTKITVVLGDDNLPTKGSVRFAPQNSIETQAKVVPLVEGLMYPTEKGYFMIGSVTFIADQGYYIVVDSPSATDQVSKDQMFKVLNTLGVLPSQVQMAVTTHGHPDHFGQANFFPNARHFFSMYEYHGATFTRTDLFNKNEIRLTDNVELWDVSVIVHNVEGHGTIAVVGDLFYSEIDALSDGRDWQRDALDGRLGLENRRRVLCASDSIVPGHSKLFRVSPEMRKRNGCPQTMSIAGITNDINTFRSDPQPTKQLDIPAPIPILDAIQPTLMTLPASLQQNATTLSQARLYAAQTLANPTIPLPTGLQQQPIYPAQQLPLASQQQPLLTADTIQSLQQSILLPFLESTAANLANYLTAAQGGVPIPQLASTQVRTSYPAFYPTSQLQVLPQQQKHKNRR